MFHIDMEFTKSCSECFEPTSTQLQLYFASWLCKRKKNTIFKTESDRKLCHSSVHRQVLTIFMVAGFKFTFFVVCLLFKISSPRQFFGLLTALDFPWGHVSEKESCDEYSSDVCLSSARILGLFPLVSFPCCFVLLLAFFFGFVGLVWFFVCERSLRKLQFKTTIEDGLNFYFCMTFLFNR